MANLFPFKPIIETLSIDKDKKLVFTPLLKEEFDGLKLEHDKWKSYPKLSPKREEMDNELKKKYGITYFDILALGDTIMETRLANQYVEHYIEKYNETEKRNYKCFVNKEWRSRNAMNLPYHEDGGCSWRCLMQKLKYPTHGVIYSKNI